MNTYRFQFDKSGKKFDCPDCGKKRFVRYIDREKGNEYLPIEFGRCDRQDHCTYFTDPYKSGYADEIFKSERTNSESLYTNTRARARVLPVKISKAPEIKPIPESYFTDSVKPAKNELLFYIRDLAGLEKAKQIKALYNIGTYQNPNIPRTCAREGTIYWYIDDKGVIRTGKIMQYKRVASDTMYLKADIKRVKEHKPAWVHNELGFENPPKCLFGQHLLKNTTLDTIAIFEAEKTAVLSSIYLPYFICLATGGSENFNRIIENVAALKGKKVILYPDLMKFDTWNAKAKELRRFGIDYSVSHLLEEKATQEERKAGFDFADYLLRMAPPIPELPVTIKKVQPILTPQQMNLEKMKTKNHDVISLIGRLELELITNS